MRTIISSHGPFAIGVELIQAPGVGGRESTVRIRKCFGQSVGQQQGQATAGALLDADLESVILVRTGRVEGIADYSELRVRQQSLAQGCELTKIVEEILVGRVEAAELSKPLSFQGGLCCVGRPGLENHAVLLLFQTVRAQRQRNFRIDLIPSDQSSR